MRWVAVLFMLTVTACGGADLGPARFSAKDCRTVVLVDDRTKDPVIGAEDLDFDPLQEILWVSAYDRLRDQVGGVYAVKLGRLTSNEVSVTNLLVGSKPHGLALREDGHGFFVVNRQPPIGQVAITAWQKAPGDVIARIETINDDDLCAANDVVQAKGVLWVTVDRAKCSGASAERVRGTKAGRLLKMADEKTTVQSDLFLPNGVTALDDEVWFAEMRSQRLRSVDGGSVNLPGSPDNLTHDGSGIIAALQPSLWRFGLYRYGYVDRAPTRIVRILPDMGKEELLFDDPRGELLSGATAAVLTGDGVMVASSVRGEHLLVCEAPA